jgi:hypothetical protein
MFCWQWCAITKVCLQQWWTPWAVANRWTRWSQQWIAQHLTIWRSPPVSSQEEVEATTGKKYNCTYWSCLFPWICMYVCVCTCANGVCIHCNGSCPDWYSSCNNLHHSTSYKIHRSKNKVLHFELVLQYLLYQNRSDLE